MSKNIEICKAEEVGAQVLDELAKDISSVQERAKQYGISIASPDPSTAKITELRAVLSVFATKVMDVFNSFIAGLQSTIASLNTSIAAYVAQIADMNSDIADAYDAVEGKGGTLPQEQTSANLPTAIESIPSGGEGKVKPSEIHFNSRADILGTDFSLIDASNITDFIQAFYNIAAPRDIILDIDSFVCRPRNCSLMFYANYGCKEIRMRGIDMSANPNVSNMFGACHVEILRVGQFFVKGVDLSSTQLAHDGLVQFFNDLPTITTSQTITIGATKQALLSQDEKNIAISKGWQLA